MQTSFTLLLLSFCTGVALQLILTQLPALAWVIVGDVVLLGLVAWRFYGLRLRSSPPTNSRLTSCLSLLISALLGWNSTMHHAVQRAAHSLAPHANGQTFWVQGHVVSMVQRQAHGLRFDLAVDSVHAIKTTNAHVADAQTRPTVQTVRVTWPAPPSDSVHPGQGWRFALTLRLPHSPINPAGLDGELLRWQQGLDAYALVHKSTPQAATLLADSAWLAPIARLRQYWRTRIEATLENHARSTQWVAALTLGDQAAIDSQDWQLFQRSGIAHLMSISGLHITLFAWLTIQALVRLGRIWAVQHAASFHALPFTMTQIATWLGVALATAYALLSGWGLPAQRTICMLVCFVGVRSLSLYWPWWQAAAFALALICAFDPWALLQPGFWLSFVAVSLLFISNPRQRPGPVAATAPEPSAATGLAQRDVYKRQVLQRHVFGRC